MLKTIQGEYYSDKDIFTNIKIEKPDTLREIITRLDKLKLSGIDTDIKGDAFEYFLKSSTATSNDLGEYFTPRHIVKAVINLVVPKFGETIYDPFCGTGGFLTEAFNFIRDKTIIRTAEDKKFLTHETIYGGEITSNARLAKMNMILHGDGHNGVKRIDSLDNPVENKYDILVTNMPFSLKIVKEIYEPEVKKTIKRTMYTNLYENGLAKNNGDGVCMLHCFKALKKGGRMALIVPEGVLFKQELKAVRQFLMENSKLTAVISLPQGIFLPYTGVKTDILYFTQCKTGKTNKVWFFDVKNDGFTLDNHRKKIKENDLKKIDYVDLEEKHSSEEAVENDRIKEFENLGFMQVDYETIKNEDYNLSVNRYKRDEKTGGKWLMVELWEVCDIVNGYAFESNKLSNIKNNDEYLPIIKIGNLISNNVTNFEEIQYYEYNKSLSKYIIETNSILFAMTGATVGKVSLYSSETKSLLNQRVGLIRANNKKILNKYLLYFLYDEKFYSFCQDNSSGGAQANISIKVVQKYKIPLPPLEVQEQVVKEIEGYEKVIAGCREVVDNWKPKFDVRKEWEMVELGDKRFFKIESGGTPDSDNKAYWDGNVNWITIADVSNENNINFIVESFRKITEIGLKNSSAKLLPINSIIVSSRATIGRVGVVKQELATNQGFKNIIFKTNDFLPEFVAYFMFLKKDEMISKAIGGTFKEISKGNFETIKIPLPPLKEQEEIVYNIENEEKCVNECKKMIGVFEEKVRRVINGVMLEE